MIISLDYNFIFMKVNKTASSSIELFLSEKIEKEAIVTPINPGGKMLYEGRNVPTIRGNPVFQNHESLAEIRDSLGIPNYDFFKNSKKVSCVRNPWSLMATTYEWRKKKKDSRALNNDFKNWLFGNFDLSMYKVPHVMTSIFNSDGKSRYHEKNESFNTKDPIVDKIIRFEKLEEDFKEVCKFLGIENKNEIIRKTASSGREKKYHEYYDDESAELVYKNFEPLIKYFKYRFDEKEI